MNKHSINKNHQWPQFLAVFLAGFLSVGSGIQMAWPSPSVPKLLAGEMGFAVSAEEASYIVMVSPLGYVIGSPLTGLLLNVIGRKYTLLILAPIQIITCITVMFAENVLTICIARIMMGISDGGLLTAMPAYIGEIMEPKVRGVGSTSLSLGLLVGALIINIYGSYMPIRTSACISLAAPVIFILTFVWMPESPYYYLAKEKDEKARNCLKQLRKVDDVEDELCGIRKSVIRAMSHSGKIKDIFTIRSNLKPFVLLTLLRTLQQFSGVYAIGFYMQTVFEISNSVLSPQLSSILCNTLRIPFTFASSIMIDRFGRKVMLSTSCLGTALCLSIMATYFYFQGQGHNLQNIKWLPLTVMVVYYAFCSMGLLVVPNIMMGELLSGSIKAKALGIMNIYYGLCMSACSKLFQWTEKNFGVSVPFFIFATLCLFGLVFVYIFIPETKGKSLEDIQEILNRPKNSKKSTTICEVYRRTNID